MLCVMSGFKKGINIIQFIQSSLAFKIHAKGSWLEWKPHLEHINLAEARARNWLDYLDLFEEWDKYIPH